MVEVISETKPKARKTYTCDSCFTILQGGTFNQFAEGAGLTFAEKRALVEAKQSNYKIWKGEIYNKQVNKQDGDIYTWRSIPAIHAICCKYDMYVD